VPQAEKLMAGEARSMARAQEEFRCAVMSAGLLWFKSSGCSRGRERVFLPWSEAGEEEAKQLELSEKARAVTGEEGRGW